MSILKKDVFFPLMFISLRITISYSLSATPVSSQTRVPVPPFED